MEILNYDGLEVDAIERHVDNGFSIAWSAPHIGFGELTFWWEGYELHVDTECMSDEFVKTVLSKAVDKMHLH